MANELVEKENRTEIVLPESKMMVGSQITKAIGKLMPNVPLTKKHETQFEVLGHKIWDVIQNNKNLTMKNIDWGYLFNAVKREVVIKGLDPSARNHIHVLPFWNSNKGERNDKGYATGGFDLEILEGYEGVMAFMLDNNKIGITDIQHTFVYEKDDREYKMIGDKQYVFIKPSSPYGGTSARGKLVGILVNMYDGNTLIRQEDLDYNDLKYSAMDISLKAKGAVYKKNKTTYAQAELNLDTKGLDKYKKEEKKTWREKLSPAWRNIEMAMVLRSAYKTACKFVPKHVNAITKIWDAEEEKKPFFQKAVVVKDENKELPHSEIASFLECK